MIESKKKIVVSIALMIFLLVFFTKEINSYTPYEGCSYSHSPGYEIEEPYLLTNITHYFTFNSTDTTATTFVNFNNNSLNATGFHNLEVSNRDHGSEMNCPLGECIDFNNNGSDFDYINLTDVDFGVGGAVSIAFWINHTSNTATNTYFIYELGGNDEFAAQHDINDLKIFIDDTLVDTGLDLTDVGEWQHIVITWNNTEGNVTVWQDGVNTYKKDKIEVGTSLDKNGVLMIGCSTTSHGLAGPIEQCSQGLFMDEFGVWNTILNETQILALNSSFNPYDTVPTYTTDWVINETCEIYDSTFYIEGNLSLYSQASVNFSNVTLIFNDSKADGDFGIFVYPDATLNIFNNSIVTSDSYNTFWFVDYNTSFTLNNTFVNDTGWGDEFYQRGIEINTTNTIFENVTLIDNYCGLLLYQNSSRIYDSNISSNTKCGIFINNSDNHYITNNHIETNALDTFTSSNSSFGAEGNDLKYIKNGKQITFSFSTPMTPSITNRKTHWTFDLTGNKPKGFGYFEITMDSNYPIRKIDDYRIDISENFGGFLSSEVLDFSDKRPDKGFDFQIIQVNENRISILINNTLWDKTIDFDPFLGSVCYGVYSENSDHSNITSNVLDTNTDTNIHLLRNNWTYIFNNTILGGNDGIKLIESTSNTIDSNEIATSAVTGIYIEDSNHSLISNNNVSNGLSLIGLTGTVINTTIWNSNLTNCQSDHCVYFNYNVRDLYFEDTHIRKTAADNTYSCLSIFADNSLPLLDNLNFKNLTLDDCDNIGVNIDNDFAGVMDGITFYDLDVEGDSPLYFRGVLDRNINVTLINSKVTTTTPGGIYLENAEVLSLNTTIDEKWSTVDTSSWTQKYYLDVFANDTFGEPVDVNVNVSNLAGALIYTQTTGSGGAMPTQNTTAWIQTGVSTKNDYSNISLNFWGDYLDNSYNFNFTATASTNISYQVHYQPITPTPGINSTTGTDLADEDLNCFVNLSDNDADSMNVTVEWFKDNVLDSNIAHYNDYANGTLFIAVLESENTTAGDEWHCGVEIYDDEDNSTWVNSTTLEILSGAAPGGGGGGGGGGGTAPTLRAVGESCSSSVECATGICDTSRNICVTSLCGNGICDQGETSSTCARDCTFLRNFDLGEFPILYLFIGGALIATLLFFSTKKKRKSKKTRKEVKRKK